MKKLLTISVCIIALCVFAQRQSSRVRIIQTGTNSVNTLQPGTGISVIPINPTTPVVPPDLFTDWSTRVTNNGGPMPSQTEIIAMETLRTNLIAAGLTNKIYTLSIFVTSSVIAATTPLIKHKGADPWTNVNFSITNLNIHGLKGDGTTKALSTGVKAKVGEGSQSDGSKGLTVIVTESDSNRSATTIGQQDGTDTPLFLLNVSHTGASGFFPVSLIGGNFVQTNDFGRVGYISGNATTNGVTTNVHLYVASPNEVHKTLATSTMTTGTATTSEDIITVFSNRKAGTNTAWSAQRLSMACVHDGFTQTESSNFWVYLKQCREALGGGTGSPIQNWTNKIFLTDGSTVSSNTYFAISNFYTGLDTDAVLYNLAVVNPYVPDNLTAARTPIVWQGGSEIWTNLNFASTNLTVNGITGNLTNKSFGTGIIPPSLNNRGFSSTSAGLTLLIKNIPATGNLYDFGTGGASGNSQFALINNAGTLFFYCWKFINVNQDFVAIAAPSPGATFASYLSGNRTAANAIALYYVTNGVHNLATNATGAQTGSTVGIPTASAAAINANGTITAWSDHTVSFIAIHSGLTQTQSSNLFIRVNALRTALGGGNL